MLSKSAVRAIFERVARDSERLHGPYRVAIGGLPSRMAVGTKATVTIRVLAESGAAVPKVGLSLSGSGLAGVPGSVETDDSGIARVELTAADAGELTLMARSEPLALTLPAYYFPSTPVGARNGQRLLAPDSQRVTGTSAVTVGKVRIAASTVARPGTVLAGRPAFDVVTSRALFPATAAQFAGLFTARSGLSTRSCAVVRRLRAGRSVQTDRAHTGRRPCDLRDRASTRTRRSSRAMLTMWG